MRGPARRAGLRRDGAVQADVRERPRRSRRRSRRFIPAGDRDRRERPAERVDEQRDRAGLLWQRAVEDLDRVGEVAALEMRVAQDDDGVLGEVVLGVEVGQHGVGRVVREAVLAFVPHVDEVLRRHVADLALGPIGEVERRRRERLQGDRPVGGGQSVRRLDKQRLDLLEVLLGDLWGVGNLLIVSP